MLTAAEKYESRKDGEEPDMALLEVNNLKKIYTTRFGGNQVEALKSMNFSVEEGEYVAIMGESGSGKRRFSIFLPHWISRLREKSF